MTKLASAEESFEGATLEGLYRLGPVLREGGMGTVHEALQIRLNKRVAVKVVARELAGDAEALVRFRREAEITSAIGHPHIVQILDFGTTPGGAPFLVMELLEGEDLEHRLGRVGRLDPPDMLRIIKQVASALAAVHAKGVVHRDLKPANIFLLDVAGETDFVKVLDFGVSKMGTARTSLSGGGKVLGTPKYMSREQAQGLVGQIDERTDEWALACIAWEAVSGRPPFVAEDELAILYQVVHEPPAPLVTAAPGGCFALEQVLRRALAKDKGERFAHVTDFAYALEKAVMVAGPANPSRSERPSGATLPLAAAQCLPRAGSSGLRFAHRAVRSSSANRNLRPDLRSHRARRPQARLARGENPRMKWLWPFAAAALVLLLGDLPAGRAPQGAPPAGEAAQAPRPALSADPVPPEQSPDSPSATRTPVSTAEPATISAPSTERASDGEPDRPRAATLVSKEPTTMHAHSASKAQATIAKDPAANVAPPRLPLEQRLIREL